MEQSKKIEEICKRAIELPTCPVKRADAIARRVRLSMDIEKLLNETTIYKNGPPQIK